MAPGDLRTTEPVERLHGQVRGGLVVPHKSGTGYNPPGRGLKFPGKYEALAGREAPKPRDALPKNHVVTPVFIGACRLMGYNEGGALGCYSAARWASKHYQVVSLRDHSSGASAKAGPGPRAA